MGAGAFIPFLTAAEHDAKGQRLSVALGNGTASTYEYDPDTFRMTRLRTARPANATVLQDIRYIFDPVGNVVSLADAAQAVVFHGGEQVRPERRFEYDAVYQLVRATGRESRAPATQPNHTDLVAVAAAHPHDVQAVRNYVEEYEYDDLGNIGRLRHVAAGGSWTRRYQYAYETNPADLTNRLTGTSEPGDPDGVFSSGYTYDPSGGMLTMPHLAGGLAWNVFDQLAEVDLGGGGRAFHVYGAGGQRMRKVIERNGNTKLEWIFLGPVMIFRRRRRDTDQLRFERWTVHLGDGAGHVAQADIKTRDDDDEDPANAVGAPLIRYQYSNHLGSVMLETDTNGDPVSYEEYHPYGTSAYRAARPGAHLSLKRFRFSGKERDDETGLYYFGARYYAPWLGRWTSADPAGFADGLNLYAFSLNNPATLSDPTGTQSTDSKVKWIVPKSVTTKEKFEQWAKRAGIQYSGEPAYDKGTKIWSAGNWTRVAPGQGGAVHPNPTGTGLGAGAGSAGSPTAIGAAPPNVPAPGEFGSVAPYNKQPPAEYGAAGDRSTRLTENEHVMPGQQLKDMTRNPASGQSAYNDQSYRKDATLRVEREMALNKTHGNRGGPTADNPRTSAMQSAIQSGRGVNYREDVFEASRQNALRAARATGSVVTEENINRAVLHQEGNLFGTHRGSVMNALPPQTAGQRISEGIRNFGRSLVYTTSGQSRFSAAGTTLARGLIPGFGAAEMGASAAPYVVAQLGITSPAIVNTAAAMAAAPAVTASIALVSAAGGYFVGDAVGDAVTEWTDNKAVGVGAGTLAGAGTGAAIGAGIGSFFGVVGAGPGAVVGGIIGGIAGFIGSFW
jgi:RHS repeat-associated protein